MNRLTRDGILHRALSMIDSPALDAKDRSSDGSVISPDALSASWLQDGLDYFFQTFPWAQITTSAAVTITTAGSVTLPTDFVLDCKDGLVIPTVRRVRRWSLQKYIRASITAVTAQAGGPMVYVVTPPTIKVLPAPTAAMAATLWYYALPAVLAANTVPNFPSDWALVEYVRLRGLEWSRALPPGTAMEYAEKVCGKLRRAGLGNEPEDDEIELDIERFRPTGPSEPWAWMGSSAGST